MSLGPASWTLESSTGARWPDGQLARTGAAGEGPAGVGGFYRGRLRAWCQRGRGGKGPSRSQLRSQPRSPHCKAGRSSPGALQPGCLPQGLPPGFQTLQVARSLPDPETQPALQPQRLPCHPQTGLLLAPGHPSTHALFAAWRSAREGSKAVRRAHADRPLKPSSPPENQGLPEGRPFSPGSPGNQHAPLCVLQRHPKPRQEPLGSLTASSG